MVAKKFCPEGSRVIIQTQKNNRDMYARYLSEVFFQGQNISDFLIATKVVKEF